MAFPSAGKVRREPCAKCSLPVFIAERLNVGKLLYHRTCFRCARCNSQLTLANYYETENNEFCCETCPDEEKSVFKQPDSSVLTRSLSDEEKSASLKKNEEDDYSAKFETALEYPEDGSLKRNSTLNSSQYTKARSFFISSQVEDSDSGNEDEPPDLPKTKPPARIENVTFGGESFGDSGFPKDKKNVHVHSVSLGSASAKLEKSHDIVTKDAISAEGNTSSLVKARMRLFETKSDAPNETRSVNNKVPLRNASASGEVGQDNKEDSSLHSFKDSTIHKDTGEDKTEVSMKSDKVEDSVITISDSVITVSDSEENASQDTPSVITDTELTPKTQQETSETPIIDDVSVKPDEDDTHTSPQIELNPPQQIPEQIPEEIPECIVTEASIATPATPPQPEYPDDLNPFGDEDDVEPDEESKKIANVSLNPFDDEDDEPEPSPKPTARRKIKPTADDKELSTVYIERISVNPFDEDDEPPQPAKRKIVAPKISLNPFWSDDEENDSKPVPKPRLTK